FLPSTVSSGAPVRGPSVPRIGTSLGKSLRQRVTAKARCEVLLLSPSAWLSKKRRSSLATGVLEAENRGWKSMPGYFGAQPNSCAALPKLCATRACRHNLRHGLFDVYRSLVAPGALRDTAHSRGRAKAPWARSAGLGCGVRSSAPRLPPGRGGGR